MAARWTSEEDDKIKALRASGFSNFEIAKQVGRSFHSIGDRFALLSKAGKRGLPRKITKYDFSALLSVWR